MLVRIEIENVGQAFACRAVIRSVRTGRKLAATGERPYSFRASVFADALDLADGRGWAVEPMCDEVAR